MQRGFYQQNWNTEMTEMTERDATLLFCFEGNQAGHEKRQDQSLDFADHVHPKKNVKSAPPTGNALSKKETNARCTL